MKEDDQNPREVFFYRITTRIVSSTWNELSIRAAYEWINVQSLFQKLMNFRIQCLFRPSMEMKKYGKRTLIVTSFYLWSFHSRTSWFMTKFDPSTADLMWKLTRLRSVRDTFQSIIVHPELPFNLHGTISMLGATCVRDRCDPCSMPNRSRREENQTNTITIISRDTRFASSAKKTKLVPILSSAGPVVCVSGLLRADSKKFCALSARHLHVELEAGCRAIHPSSSLEWKKNL